jgi:YVTN family beta-propeller protein
MMRPSATRSLGVLAAVGLLVGRGSDPTESRLSVDSVPLGGTPFAVAIAPSGITYVTQASGASAARAEQPRPPFSLLVPVGPVPSQVRMSPTGQTAYVANQNMRTVTFVNVVTNQPFDTVAVPAGSILTIGLSPGGERVYALTDYHGVYVIDALDRTVIDSIPETKTGHILTGVAFHPTAPRMYVAARDAGTVAVIDTDADTVVTTYAAHGARIQNVAVARDGSELYGTDIQRSGLVIWDLRSGGPDYVELLIGSGRVRNAFDVAVTPNNRRLYVSTLADGRVYILDRATRRVRGSIVTGGSPRYIAFDRNGTRAVIPNEMGWVNFIH